MCLILQGKNGLLGQPNITFANLAKSRYRFDSFISQGYCYVAVVIFLIWQSKWEQVSAPD